MAQLHEHQAKKILSGHGIAIPRGIAVSDPAKARDAAKKLGGEVVVKAQIHSTSRAAAGGIKFASDAEDAGKIAREMLGSEIAGNLVETVLIDEKLSIEKEFYLGFIIDDRQKRPVLLFSDSGGSGIEQRAGSMKKLVCSIRDEPAIKEIGTIVESSSFGFSDAVKEDKVKLEISAILQNLYRSAKSCEARTAEINPLALLSDGRLVAADARISVDDYSVFRHEDLGIEMARELGHTPTRLEKIAWEVEKDDFRGTFYFVEILSSADCGLRIGFHGAGGGGSMASLDAAQRNGLSPACYVDTSGNPPASKVYRAAKIILSIPGIRGYFLSGSGVASQEQFGLARAVIKAFREVVPHIPAVLRLGGNGEEYAKELVEKYSARLPAPMEAYQKSHSADFCAARLNELIKESKPSKSDIPASAGGFFNNAKAYTFKTRTGTISFDHEFFKTADASPIVAACPASILKLDGRNLPVLAIEPEEAERGKCIECLACEFAAWDHGHEGVKIDLPIAEDGFMQRTSQPAAETG